MQITLLFERPRSAEALAAGLPVPASGLDPALFVRAAERAGIEAEVIRLPLQRMDGNSLPAVLLFDGASPCLALGVDGDALRTVTAGGSLDSVQSQSKGGLEASYSGYAIAVRPVPDFESVVPALGRKHWLWSVLKPSWPLYIEVAIASVLVNLFTLASPFFVMNVYDRVVPNRAIETLWVLAVGIGVVYTFDFLIKQLRVHFVDSAGRRADVALASRLFSHILGTRLADHPKSLSAYSGYFSEFESLRDFITSATLLTVLDLPFSLLFIGVIALIGGPLVLVPAIAAPVVFLAGLLLQIPLRGLIEQGYRCSKERHNVLMETLATMETIKTIGAEGRVQRRWEEALAALAQNGVKARSISGLVVHFATFVQQAAVVLLVVYGVYLISDGALSVGALIACTVLTGRALAPFSQLAGLLIRLHQSRASMASISRILEQPLERPQGQEFLSRKAVKGALEFRNVTFRYRDQQNAALQDVSFRIAPGERVGIIGRIGSGKSTIQKLLIGLYGAEQGSVLVDGIDVRQFDPVDLRSGIGTVLQDVVLMDGTVRENIAAGKPRATDEEVLEAAELAAVTDFVSEEPAGFELEVGEGGRRLSGGQRQAVSLARALIKKPGMLLLDEPTSAMDNLTEERVKANLARYSAGRTLVLVTHRSSLLSLVDRLILLEKGRVIADGPKKEVIELLKQRAGGPAKVSYSYRIGA